jgi:hypothetical protein
MDEAMGQNNLVPLDHMSGSRPLKIKSHELYCRHRASALGRIEAWRKSGHIAANDHVAEVNSRRLEKSPFIQARINYLVKQTEDRIAEKRTRIEERLWAIHEANIQDFFVAEDDLNPTDTSNNPAEIANNAGQGKVGGSPRARVVPRLLTELDPETAKLIEDVQIDRKGRAVPRLYSKAWANAELRKMLNISAKSEPPDVTKLSDAELIETLARQAKELGVEIDLSYSFAQPKKKAD